MVVLPRREGFWHVLRRIEALALGLDGPLFGFVKGFHLELLLLLGRGSDFLEDLVGLLHRSSAATPEHGASRVTRYPANEVVISRCMWFARHPGQ